MTPESIILVVGAVALTLAGIYVLYREREKSKARQTAGKSEGAVSSKPEKGGGGKGSEKNESEARQTADQWKKEKGGKNGWRTLAIIALLVLVGLLVWPSSSSYEQGRAAGVASVQKEVVRSPTEHAWQYRLEKNPNTVGINSRERVIDLPMAMTRNEERGIMSFTVFHREADGRFEPAVFIMDKASPDRPGTWSQERPQGRGLWWLKATQTIQGGYCIRVSSTDYPDDWNDAYLTPL